MQGSQNAFDVNFEARQLEINHVLEAASAQSQRNYQISALVFISMIIVAAIYISSALWWTRKMIVQPLAIIGSHFDSIAAGNLARPIAVYGRNEITAIFASLKTMQQALRGTVSDVRKGSRRCTLVSRRLSQAITISQVVPNSRRHRWHKRPPVWSN